MKKQNKSLMLKWLRKFMTGENMLWREVIRDKYEMENRWMTKMVTTPYGCGIWRSVRNLWPLFRSRIRFQVGNGMKVLFWEDKWISPKNPETIIPRLIYTKLSTKCNYG